MVDEAFSKQKVQAIIDDLALLEDMSRFSIEEIMADPYRHHAFNNVVQQVVQRAVDINQHILSDVDPELLASPKTYRETFMLMGEKSVLPHEFAEKIAGSGSLRNIIVHEYDNLDPKKLDEGRKKMLELYPQFCEHILNWFEEKR